MTTNPPLVKEGRLFGRFFDPVDMIASFPADATGGEVNRAAAEYGLRYPLVVDPDASLREHMDAVEAAPESFRFGAFVDNVTGMNWELPGGRAVRIGDRVVKSTTGYDLLRFLLHSGDRFGRPLDYVLRLRPCGEESAHVSCEGERDQLASALERLTSGCWSHWINRLDWVELKDKPPRIELGIECLRGESAAYFDFFSGIESDTGAKFRPVEQATSQALPDFTVKTTVSAARRIAADCRERFGASTRVLVLSGMVYVHGGSVPDAAQTTALRDMVEAQGGHLYGRCLAERTVEEGEVAVVRALEEAWKVL